MPADPGAVPVITVDGPTASGKGAVAQAVAKRLGWRYLDSGALYRLAALQATRLAVSLEDEPALARIAACLPVEFSGDQILLDGEDVSRAIREPAIGNAASRIAVYPSVRTALLGRQQAFRQAPGLVADGRDMASVVFADAPLKVFLTAAVATRAQRRHKQLIEKGFSAKLTDLQIDLERRDARDENRAVAPLKPLKESVVIDSSLMDLESVIASVVKLAGEKFGL